MVPARKAVPAPAEVTPRTLRNVTGNVRARLFRNKALACRSRTMPQIPPEALGPCHPAPQLARVEERCRTCADGVEIFRPGGTPAVRPWSRLATSARPWRRDDSAVTER